MRHKRSELEKLVADVTLKAVTDHSPGLRTAIRDLLGKGATPKHVRSQFGSRSPLYRTAPNTALSVDWIVDEWERERGLIKPDESIDNVE